MLTLVRADQRSSEARDLLRLVAAWRPDQWLVLLLPLLGVWLLAAGLPWGGLLIGGAVSLGLRCYGPSWWPGRG